MTKLYELVLQGTYQGQETINRFNYLGTGTPSEPDGAAALLQAFGCLWDGTAYPAGLPFADILIPQNTGVIYQFASARDVYSDTDFEEIPFVHVAQGTNTSGDQATPFLAFGLRTNRVRRDVRRGTKRFAGVSEGQMTAGGGWETATAGQLNDVAEALSANLTQSLDGNDYTFVPTIVGKQRYDPETGDPSETGTAYRYYPTYEDQADHLASGITWEIYDRVRSQNSRQYGKGR